ncbi:NAD(P)/FAD-dependent oxidoreductase [Aureispira anguillae]|uniref:Tryptophan 7-halogenase n=1 Tax=Aureispira anguillae TaxID=2864201 RepID=A0A915YJI3_9BACT|nr:lycopene cyclase family protein [Aureispira anguillae]BDS13983.1 tryptophan 7-halogenase [Aureispira anguillae]
MKKQYDVVILGGGLAGLTLALQLKQNEPNIHIAILEMRKNLAPESAHKVGESTVELGTYYLREVLGLGDYLDAYQLPKMGLRFYFSPQVKEEITQRVELGVKGALPVPSHQIDRGIFENELTKRLLDMGVEVILGARIKEVNLDSNGHRVSFLKEGTVQALDAKWVTDATGRAGFLKRKMGFGKPLEHDINAVWFRVKGEIDVDDWSDNKAWKDKVSPGLRRLGTIHFMGQGYWVWLIPLVSGNTSIGIVADPKFHDFTALNKLDKAMDWLASHEPLCAEMFKPYLDDVIDFRVLKHYSHHSERFYTTEKWGVVGEAGAFLDPFYSPGTDFIAIGNTWMADLILRDYNGEDIASRSIIYERVHTAFFNSWIPIYHNQYHLFGHTQVIMVKILWDWGLYWAIPTLLFTNKGYINLAVLRNLFTTPNCLGMRLGKLNTQVQHFFKEWGEYDKGTYSNAYIDFFDIPFLKKLHSELESQHSTEDLIAQCETNLSVLEQIAAEIFRKMSALYKGTPNDMKVNPYKMSMSLSKEELLKQATQKGAIDTDQSIIDDLELMWLKRDLFINT